MADLNVDERNAAVGRLSRHRQGARALLSAWNDGVIESYELPVTALETMGKLLPDDKLMQSLWENFAGRLRRVLRLNGGGEDCGPRVSLSGDFTFECWANFDDELSNADSILGVPGAVDFNFHEATTSRLDSIARRRGDC